MLKELRKARGISQDQLAEISGVRKMTISKIERGVAEMENITLRNALALAGALGVEPHELFNGGKQYMTKREVKDKVVEMVLRSTERAEKAMVESGSAKAYNEELNKIYEEAKEFAAQNGVAQKQLDIYWNMGVDEQARRANVRPADGERNKKESKEDFLKRALEEMGLTKSDIKKHLSDGTCLMDLKSYLESMDGCNAWDEEERTEFIEKFQKTNKKEHNFVPDVDLVILDGEKYLIEYCL